MYVIISSFEKCEENEQCGRYLRLRTKDFTIKLKERATDVLDQVCELF